MIRKSDFKPKQWSSTKRITILLSVCSLKEVTVVRSVCARHYIAGGGR